MTQAELDHETVKSLFRYDERTGKLFWRATRGRGKAGDEAGRINETHGYRLVHTNGRMYLAHRLIWLYVYGCWPRNNLDHLNGKRDDNRIKNLREADCSQNSSYRPLLRNNTSGCSGVYWKIKSKRWCSYIRNKGKCIHIGYFHSKDEAIAARINKEKELLGEFSPHLARQNFVIKTAYER
jgi:hypothetical protein